MSEKGLAYIAAFMDELAIPYDFMEWKAKPPDDRYFVGEASEMEMTRLEEDGQQDSTLILRGFTRGSWQTLLRDTEAIRRHLPITAMLEDGTGMAIFYGGTTPVPTADGEIKSVKTNLNIKEWRVN